jgi:hypothetical protein
MNKMRQNLKNKFEKNKEIVPEKNSGNKCKCPFWKHIKPEFWDHRDVASGRHRHLFNLRRIWYLSVLLTAGVSLMPVFFLAAIDYQVTQKAIESENMLRTSRLVSNARRTLSFFLLERKYALEFLVRDNSYEQLIDNERLNTILANLHMIVSAGSPISASSIFTAGRLLTAVLLTLWPGLQPAELV